MGCCYIAISHLQNQHPAVLGFLFRLDVDVCQDMPELPAQRGLDPVADRVRILDGHLAGHDQMEFHEGGAAGDVRAPPWCINRSTRSRRLSSNSSYLRLYEESLG